MSGLARASRYQIRRSIRRGLVAEVLEAVVEGAEGFERRVAVKRLLPELASREELVRAFIDEARIAGQLHHANIVGVIDFGHHQGIPFQVLELVEGLDLDALLNALGRPIAAGPALHVVAEVAQALDYAHQATDARDNPLGIIHRDVSPTNVLVSRSGDVKLADFGIARAFARLEKTRIGVAKGKLDFMAPEQALAGTVDARSDLFALGCVLHFLLSGKSPLEGERARRAVHAGQSPELAIGLPTEAAAIISRATRNDPAARYPSAAALASDCRRALAALGLVEPRAELRELVRSCQPKLEPERVAARRALSELLDLERVAPRAEAAGSVDTESTPGASDPPPVAAAKPVEDRSGELIDGFRLLQRIGRGASATVYRAVPAAGGAEVAFKLLRQLDSLPHAVARLRREARVLAELDHPNLVKILAAGSAQDGRPYLAMELVEGGTLSKLVKAQGPLAPARAAYFIREVALGLEAAHARGIVHRDLKPSNVLLSGPAGQERVKIVDFGLARISDPDFDGTRLTRPASLLGTPAFMAPEQISTPGEAGPAADLYALGVLWFWMLRGRAMFDGTPAEVVQLQRSAPPPPLPEAGPLEVLIRQLLEKAPDRRPAAIQVVLDAVAEQFPELPEPWQDLTRIEAARSTSAGPTALAPPSASRLGASPAMVAEQLRNEFTTPSRSTQRDRWLLNAGGAGLLILLVVLLAVANKPDFAPAPPTAPSPPLAIRTEPELPEGELAPLPEESTRPAPVIDAPNAIKERPRLTRSSEQRPPPARRASEEPNIEARLTALLAERGLSTQDLPDFPALREPLDRLRRGPRDSVSVEHQLAELATRLDRQPIDAVWIAQRLDRLYAELVAHQARLSAEQLRELDRRYLDLRERGAPGGSRRQYVELLRRIRVFERELSAGGR